MQTRVSTAISAKNDITLTSAGRFDEGMRIDIMLIWKHNPGKTPDLLSGVK